MLFLLETNIDNVGQGRLIFFLSVVGNFFHVLSVVSGFCSEPPGVGRTFKKKLILVLRYLARKYLNKGHYLYVSNSRRESYFTCANYKVKPLNCSAKAVPSFLSYFKTLSIGPGPGIESRGVATCTRLRT